MKRAESRARYYIREQAQKRGWKVSHLSVGGDFLEEQEIVDYFPSIGLRLDRPDFLTCLFGEPVGVIEAKNDATKIDDAISEAIDYANQINSTGAYNIRLAVGAAGEEDVGFTVYVRYLVNGEWVPLLANGCEITTIPSKVEAELAINADDATTSVDVPSNSEFIDAAIELSRILRTAKVEAPLRPKVIGAIVLAMYKGPIDTARENGLSSINSLVSVAITESQDLPDAKKQKLIDALRLSGADFDRLSPLIGQVVALLRRLNIRSVLQTDTDFLGMFYEAFLRYGYDNNALGIVFTPRHITKFCVELLGVRPTDKVVDIACGTGGFLVAAFDSMMSQAQSPRVIESVKNSLYGFDTNPTVWALATLNMFFRGDGKSHIEQGNCFEPSNKQEVYSKCTRAFLNPPFSQDDEPERDFIDASLEALEPEGTLAVVVKAGIFADDDHRPWRREFLRRHTLLGVISLPEDLFYPTSAPTSILLAKAHIPQAHDSKVFTARIWNDGFEKLKNRRVHRDGSQLPEIKLCFDKFMSGEPFSSKYVISVSPSDLLNGEEWSPQQHLPQPHLSEQDMKIFEQEVIRSIYQSVAIMPDLSDEVLSDFISKWATLQSLPLSESKPVNYFFNVLNGKSQGEKNYADGTCPYISSGDQSNSIVRLVAQDDGEIFPVGGITVTAFGKAYVQPWAYMARGNGGSAVRTLIPKYNMSFKELIWFAAQINAQQWRFFYARMSIKSRLERLVVQSPPVRLPDTDINIADRVRAFKESLIHLSTY